MSVRVTILLVLAFMSLSPVVQAYDEAMKNRLISAEGCPGCDLAGANLNGMNLIGQDLSGANLNGANLGSAELYNANLSGADLTNANLANANLSGANFRGATMTGANLNGVHPLNMENADFTDAMFCNTRWIDGSIKDDNC